jgi:hypothetical protein
MIPAPLYAQIVDNKFSSAIGYLTDVGYFTDTFKVDVLE